MSYGKSMPAYVTHNPYIILYIPDFALYTLILNTSYFTLHIMNISELSIRRPVLSTVLTLIILGTVVKRIKLYNELIANAI